MCLQVRKLAEFLFPTTTKKPKKSFKQLLLGYQWDLKVQNRGIMYYESVPVVGIAPAYLPGWGGVPGSYGVCSSEEERWGKVSLASISEKVGFWKGIWSALGLTLSGWIAHMCTSKYDPHLVTSEFRIDRKSPGRWIYEAASA